MAQKISGEDIYALWENVRKQGPLVQCITNFVSMDIMANALLALGASPAMAHSTGELEDFASIASALLINVGSLTADWIASFHQAAGHMSRLGKPWVLDPVGCGATKLRTQTCKDLLALRPTVVRGNASEVLALGGAAGAAATKGVDSTAGSSEALGTAVQLARTSGTVVAVSGAVDLVTDGVSVWEVSNGVEMLTKITAAGCSVTAIIAAFCASNPKAAPGLAAAAALAVFGLAAERAAKAAHGPGSLRVGLIDQLYSMDRQAVEDGIRVAVRTL